MTDFQPEQILICQSLYCMEENSRRKAGGRPSVALAMLNMRSPSDIPVDLLNQHWAVCI